MNTYDKFTSARIISCTIHYSAQDSRVLAVYYIEYAIYSLKINIFIRFSFFFMCRYLSQLIPSPLPFPFVQTENNMRKEPFLFYISILFLLFMCCSQSNGLIIIFTDTQHMHTYVSSVYIILCEDREAWYGNTMLSM